MMMQILSAAHTHLLLYDTPYFSNDTPLPQVMWFGACIRSDRSGLCLYAYFQPLVCSSNVQPSDSGFLELIFGPFVIHKFSIFSPPPPISFLYFDRLLCHSSKGHNLPSTFK